MSEGDAPALLARPPRWRRWKVALLGFLGLVGAGAFGFRAWVNRDLGPDAPRVALSIGADWANDVGLHQATYQAVLRSLGGQAEQVSPRDGRSASEILDGADCLVLTGGGDVDPALYGGDADKAQLVARERDEFEAALIREALRRDMPILAVCRGHQILNVAFGGSLRDIRDDPVLKKAHGISARSLVAHPVDLAPGSRVRHLAGGAAQIEVNSFHGQVLDRLGAGLKPTATSPDGVVEAVEVEGATWAVGVQWHPEMIAFADPHARALFERVLEQARAYRARRAKPRPGRDMNKTGRGSSAG